MNPAKRPCPLASITITIAVACAMGCGSSRQEDGAPGGGDWLACMRDTDCAAHADAVRCADDGYCQDATGARVTKLAGNGPVGDGDGDGDDTTKDCEPGVERCNGVDDDCDGVVDEADAADADCEARIPNAVTFCDPNKGVCIPIKCKDGFNDCDGLPSNGCEPVGSCAQLDSGMGDDAGQQE